MILFPNAKINIGLNIVKKRSDGFHEIETAMFPTCLTDVLEITKVSYSSDQKIKLTISGIKVDSKPEDNLVYKAFVMLDKEFNLSPISVHLHKSIPIGAGLGGGSADAAYMLKGLNEMFELDLDDDRLEHYAARLGSDCPFFIRNKPSFATGRGELLNPIQIELKNYYIVIVIPNTSISTAEAYSKVAPQEPKNSLSESIELPVESWKTFIKNDFEESVFTQKPEIEIVKKQLLEAGATYASLSGSGSAVYGIFREKPEIKEILQSNYFTWFSKV